MQVMPCCGARGRIELQIEPKWLWYTDTWGGVFGFGEGGGRVQSEEWMAYLEPVHCQTGNINNWLENSPVTHMNVAILLTLDLFTESLLLIF